MDWERDAYRKIGRSIARVSGRMCAVALILVAIWVACEPHPRYEWLLRAIDSRNVAAVRLCLDAGTDPNTFYRREGEDYDMAPLCNAVANRDTAVVELLLARGASPNVFDGDNGTPLEAAARCDDLAMMGLLIAHGAKVNDDGWGGSYALEAAVAEGNMNAARFLLRHGANANTVVNDVPPRTLLYDAELRG